MRQFFKIDILLSITKYLLPHRTQNTVQRHFESPWYLHTVCYFVIACIPALVSRRLTKEKDEAQEIAWRLLCVPSTFSAHVDLHVDMEFIRSTRPELNIPGNITDMCRFLCACAGTNFHRYARLILQIFIFSRIYQFPRRSLKAEKPV